MQIAVLMSFVVICCYSQGAIIKKEEASARPPTLPHVSRVEAAPNKQDFMHNRVFSSLQESEVEKICLH